MVRSILPLLNPLTRSRSSKFRPPPAYVTGILHHSASLPTNCSSIPFCRPSLSAAWIKNSEQYGSRDFIDAEIHSAEISNKGEDFQQTFVDLHICDSLPFVHGYEPSVAFLPAAEVNHKFLLISTKCSENILKTFLRESTFWK